MRKTKALWFSVMCLFILLLASGCGSSNENASNSGQGGGTSDGSSEPITIKVGHMNSETHSFHKGMLAFKEGVESRTNNEVTIEIYPNGQLGENKEVLEQARLGGNVIAQFSVGTLGEYVPDYGILLGPYLFENWDEASKVFSSDLVKGWEDQVAEKSNIRILGYFNFGVRDLYTVEKPVRHPDDMDGLKIRVQPVKMYTEMISAMGGAPTPMPWPEVYNALSQQVVDGAEAPPSAIVDQKHFEHAKYLSLDNHMVDVSPVAMADDVFQTLSTEQQNIVMEEAKKALDQVTQMNNEQRESFIKELEENGMEVIRDVDREAFKEATKDVYTKFPDWSPGLYDKIQKIINQ